MLARSGYLCAVVLLASASLRATVPSYTSIEIPAPAGANGNASASGINAQGDVAGSYSSAAGASGGFVYYHRSGSEVVLTGSPNPGALAAYALNDLDQVVGQISGPQLGIEAVEWLKNGGETVLPANTLAMATAINNSGTIAGNMDNGHENNLAVMWTGAAHTLAELGVLWVDPTLPDYASSTASAVNGQGHVAGSSFAGQGTTFQTAQPFGTHAFLYRGGKMLDLGALAPNASDNDSEGYGLNNLDEVVGLSATTIPARNSLGQPCPSCGLASHAFLWRTGKMTDLGNLANVPGWDSKADAINDQGEIVGWSDSTVNGAATHRAFLYVSGQMLNLQFYVFDRDPNVRLTEAVDINCEGWIVANGFNVKTPNAGRVYLLIPRGPPRRCT
jgi:probable HAF family extracellular repeat protein